MMIIGLLSTQEEVEEIKNIAKIANLEDRIHFLCRMQKIKDLLKKE
jgi:ferritin-like protein